MKTQNSKNTNEAVQNNEKAPVSTTETPAAGYLQGRGFLGGSADALRSVGRVLKVVTDAQRTHNIVVF